MVSLGGVLNPHCLKRTISSDGSLGGLLTSSMLVAANMGEHMQEFLFMGGGGGGGVGCSIH